MNSMRILLVPALCLLLISCGKSEKELATGKLELAEQLYQKGDTTGALAQADSVHLLFRNSGPVIAAADQLKKKIYGDLVYRLQDELDTIKARVSQLEENFIVEKTDLDRYAQYTHRKQDPERRWNKSYIQVHLDGTGELGISSNYYGDTWLDHTGIRVYEGDLQAKTDTVGTGHVLNHHSDFMNTKWEKVSYIKGADNGVIAFIAQHADRKLKAVFLGKRYYYIILEDYDKQAIAEGLNLSVALRQKLALEKEIGDIKSRL